MKWTDDQAAVLASRNSNLLVAAAAGSGKTAVLVERIVRLIMEGDAPPDLDRILVVTFTQAAAGEMRERIRKALLALAAEGDVRASAQLALVVDAPISTIHSFCLAVLRENFHLAGLEPGFRVGEQTECTLMLAEAMDRLMDDRYGSETLEPALADLLDCYAGYRDDRRMRDQILDLWRQSRSMPFPDKWMTDSLAQLQIPEGTDFGDTVWGRILLEQADWVLEDLAMEAERACRLSEDAGFDGYAVTFSEDLVLLEKLRYALSLGWEQAYAALSGMKFATMKRAPKEADPIVKERLQAARKHLKEGIERLRKETLPGSSEILCREIRAESSRMTKLTELAQALDRTYGRMKRRRNLVDFDDMEHMTLNLLAEPDEKGASVPTALAVSMRERWFAVMIDEYQDSNLVQETILGAVATQREDFGNLFMVGDVKQSIYRFRQAMPELFLGKYAAYPEQEGSGRRKILLHRNFRSRAPVLDAVNIAFRRLMTTRLGELDYTEDESLLAGADYPLWNGLAGAPVEFHLIDKATDPLETDRNPALDIPAGTPSETEAVSAGSTDSRETGDPEDSGEEGTEQDPGTGDPEEGMLPPEELEAVQEEAVWAAHTIRRMMDKQEGEPACMVVGREGPRPVRYSDCAILLRATSGWSQVFVEEFALQGIPLFSDTGAGYFASVEVGVVLSLLQVLDNPQQDIPLAAVLRSPIAGWNETLMASVRQADPAGTLHDSLVKQDGSHRELCRSFLDKLEQWRDLAQILPVGELLERLFDETGYALHAAALPQGRRRLANLRLLVERAARFETTGYRGLFQFIRYVERLRAGKGDMDGAKVIGEGEDVVRLMSIHKSKGLEYPVVLLCGTGKQFNLRDRQNRVLFHHRYGFGPDGSLPDLGATWPTAAKRALQTILLREMLSEEMRILYVALTRAKERLFVCGTMKAPLEMMESFKELPKDGPLPIGAVLPLRSHAQWLLAAWGSVMGKQADAPVLFVHTRAEVARMRRVADVGAASLPESLDRARIGENALFGMPGQISLFDTAGRDPVREQLEADLSEVDRRLAWKPDFPMLANVPAKMTVTALKRLWEERDEASAQLEDAFRLACTAAELDSLDNGRAARDDSGLPVDDSVGKPQVGLTSQEQAVLPAFLTGVREGTRALRYGTLMHLVLQHLEPRDGQIPDLEEVIDQLVLQGLIPESDRMIPNRGALRAFLHSPLFSRMQSAGIIHRETPFTVRMAAGDVLGDPAIPASETIVLQGIVDSWFIESGKIVLVDYKTDRSRERVPAYRRQLSWYAAALEKVVGLPVKETILWFLHEGCAV